ncbi:hypothetical protein SOPP22_10620 [Shewanella sp. OPT22]|nr:hypothetical protein SOPP22_10620 [Shewanella sp. OPT22]
MLLFVKDLTVIDFSYLCEKRGMVGESWIVDVVLDGGLDEQSMVLDFAKVKKAIKHTIDEIVDHRLLVPSLSAASRFEFTDEKTIVDFKSEVGSMHLICPKEAFTFIEATDIAFDNVIDFLKQKLSIVLPDNVNAIELTLRAEKLDTPFYHYSHGLKKHDGNCQRIAHGHRSPVTIYEDGEESLRWNQYWAERWQDIYLGSEEDRVNISGLDIDAESVNDDSHYGFRYLAPQGEFQLAIPKTVTDMIPHDTTVELLADFMAETLHTMNPEKSYKVVAFEGVGKGAIAFRN